MGKGFGAELRRSLAPTLQAHFKVHQKVPLAIKLRLERLALVELVHAMADEQGHGPSEAAQAHQVSRSPDRR